MRNPERQNSVNEVIRCNLKSIGVTCAQMVQAIEVQQTENLDSLLGQVKQNDGSLSHLLKALTDSKYVKGTFLCQFAA
jgi:enoyl-[acyl-carrier-protein] reductase (NADH)